MDAAVHGENVGLTYGGGGDVRQVGRDSRGVDNIVESELINEGRSLEEEGERLVQTSMLTHECKREMGRDEYKPGQCLQRRPRQLGNVRTCI